MDFTDDPALREYLQTVYDGIYDAHVKRNLEAHKTLQSEELASFLDEYALCAQESVPLPSFRSESYKFELGASVHRASFHEGTLAIQCWGQRNLTYFDLDTFLPSQRVYSDADNDAFICNVLQWNVAYEFPRRRKMIRKNIDGLTFLFDNEEKCYFDEMIEGDSPLFSLNGHLYQACASDSFLHIASGDHFEHNIPEYLESSALCVFTFRGILHIAYENGLIARYFFNENLPAPLPALSLEKVIAYLHERVEKQCQRDLYKLECDFRSLGDYHVRFGIRIPTPVRGLRVRNMGSFNISSQRNELVKGYIGYEDGVLRYLCLDQKVRTWNLRSGEKREEETTDNRVPSCKTFHANDNGIVEFEQARYYCDASTIPFYAVLSMQSGEEKAAYVVAAQPIIYTHSVFFFRGEWYGFCSKGISHIASNTVVSNETGCLTGVTTILVDDILYAMTSSSYTRYLLQ
jgi:hypothetical protein